MSHIDGDAVAGSPSPSRRHWPLPARPSSSRGRCALTTSQPPEAGGGGSRGGDVATAPRCGAGAAAAGGGARRSRRTGAGFAAGAEGPRRPGPRPAAFPRRRRRDLGRRGRDRLGSRRRLRREARQQQGQGDTERCRGEERGRGGGCAAEPRRLQSRAAHRAAPPPRGPDRGRRAPHPPPRARAPPPRSARWRGRGSGRAAPARPRHRAAPPPRRPAGSVECSPAARRPWSGAAAWAGDRRRRSRVSPRSAPLRRRRGSRGRAGAPSRAAPAAPRCARRPRASRAAPRPPARRAFRARCRGASCGARGPSEPDATRAAVDVGPSPVDPLRVTPPDRLRERLLRELSPRRCSWPSPALSCRSPSARSSRPGRAAASACSPPTITARSAACASTRCAEARSGASRSRASCAAAS